MTKKGVNKTAEKILSDLIKKLETGGGKLGEVTEEVRETQKAVLEVLKNPARRAICDKLVVEIGLAYNKVIADHQDSAPDEEKLLNSDALVVATLVSAHAYLSTAMAVQTCGHLPCVHGEAHIMCEAMTNVIHAAIDASQPHNREVDLARYH